MRRSSTFLTVLAALTLLASCADDRAPDDVPSNRLGLDETVPCPEGEVGWRFPTKPLDPNSEEYALRSGDDSIVTLQKRLAIEVQSASCDGASSADANDLRNDCAGSQTCTFSTTCGGAYSVTYTCGASDTAADGTQNTYTVTATNGEVSLECSAPTESTTEVEARTACIPRQCHGRARRNLDMECVEHPEALEVAVIGGFNYSRVINDRLFLNGSAWIREHYPSQAEEFIGSDSASAGEPIFATLPYDINLWVEFWYGLVPEQSTVVAWVSDTYTSRDSGDQIEAFRCVAFREDIASDSTVELFDGDEVERIRFSGRIADSCLDGGRVSGDTAAKKAGLTAAQFRQQYEYTGSKIRASYDMEGRSVWHKPEFSRVARDVDFLAFHEPECAPNPQDFYYDASTETYDLIAYYEQREFAPSNAIKFMEPSAARRGYIIPGNIKANDLTIRTASPLNASLPVDLSWSTANLTKENPFNPFVRGVDVGGAWEDGKSLPDANFGPKNLRASIFVYPFGQTDTTSRFYAYKLGEIPLSEPTPEGRTQSANLPITQSIKNYFTSSSSSAYISGDSRLYRLFYCIESDDHPQRAGDAFKVRQGQEYFVPNNGADYATRPYEQHYVMSENGTAENPPWSLALDTDRAANSQLSRIAFGKPLRGCRASSSPFRVSLDRFTTPLEPIAASGFTGSTNNESTGDEKMSGNNDNDTEINCMGSAQENCVEAVNAGNRTDGESARSTYNLDNRLGRNPGDEANSSMTAEMIGFQLIDPMDPEGSSVNFPADSSTASSTPVTITLTPDWDGIKTALERASTGSATEWETGPYGGQMGLGVGWGYKWRFQIGPIPVEVTFSFTVGASVKIEAQFQFAPTADQAYPCLGGSDCIVKVNERKSFSDAAQHCNVLGGRLSELSSQVEANAVDAQRGTEEVWLGGQLAYRHDDASCATNYVASECLGRSRTEYRWMSNSAAFASNEGGGSPTYDSASLFNATQSGLATGYPNDRGVTYRADGSLGTVGVDVQRPFLCTYESADRERFFRWQLALNMGAAAGFRLQGCVPTENPGFCLAASFNVVSFNIGPVYENIYHWLFRSGESAPYSRRGNTNISVPWALKLFEGAVTAAVNFLWFSINWPIVTYDGITAAEGKLYDSNTPVIESLQ